ncbi:helix-turn-helix transcriptional regulator [Glutamicibacter ardleyensis]|uniref:helix-turn-helix transcriptional regulator n=1 Tax=Glutamicibacter ardleyensis TaxID=225894 RepID=UPI003FD33868
MSNRPSWDLGESAERCGVSRSTVRRYREQGKFPNAFKDSSGAWKIPLEDLLAVGWKPNAPAQPEPVSVPPEPVPERHNERVAELERALELERVKRESAERLNAQIQANLDDLRQAMKMIEAKPMSVPVSVPEPAKVLPTEPAPERLPEQPLEATEQPKKWRWWKR